MKRLFNIFAMLALLAGITACEGVEEQPQQDAVVSLTANKLEIVADGTDSVTFEVTVDGVVTTKDVSIIVLNDNSTLAGSTFKTTTAGEYRFKAAYKNFTSETVTITATATTSNVELEVDKTEFTADGTDKVTFTVTVDGQDKTAESTIIELSSNTNLEGNTFTTTTEGVYTFVAEYGEYRSQQVVITAVANTPTQKSLTITTSKYRIASDGVDSATFTVLYGEEDVTATCEIRDTKGNVIEGGVFSSTTEGTYDIYALYNNQRSNTVSIDVYDPNVTYAYEIGQIYEVNGSKCVAYAIKDNFAYFFSMDEEDLQWSTENVWCNCISPKGEWNTYDPFDPKYSKADGGARDINNYPAFKWCMDHGDNWFMPSSTELKWMWDAISGGTHRFDSESVAAYNKLLEENGGEPFNETYYWSSNETSEDRIELIAFMSDSIVCLEPLKTYTYTVRAVTRVQLN